MMENEIEKFTKELILTVWDEIEFEKMSKRRLIRIYDELSSKIKYAAGTTTIESFLCRLASRFGVRNLKNKYKILDKIKNCNEKELLRYIRKNTEFIIIYLREFIDSRKENYEDYKSKNQKQIEFNEIKGGENYDWERHLF